MKALVIIVAGAIGLCCPEARPMLVIAFVGYSLYVMGRAEKVGVTGYIDQQFLDVPRPVGLVLVLPAFPALVLMAINGAH